MTFPIDLLRSTGRGFLISLRSETLSRKRNSNFRGFPEGVTMTRLCKRLLIVAAGAVVWASVHPSIMSAQTSGVGTDGYTRVLWRATNGSVSVWKVDANLNYVD